MWRLAKITAPIFDSTKGDKHQLQRCEDGTQSCHVRGLPRKTKTMIPGSVSASSALRRFISLNLNLTTESARSFPLTSMWLGIELTPEKFRIPYTDLKPKITKFLPTKWQQRWNNNTLNKLFQIQPTLGEWRPFWENQGENKSLYPDCTVVRQELLTLSYWNKNNNHVLWHVRCLAPLNTSSLNIEISLHQKAIFQGQSLKWSVQQRQNEWRYVFPERDRVVLKNMMKGIHLIVWKQMKSKFYLI